MSPRCLIVVAAALFSPAMALKEAFEALEAPVSELDGSTAELSEEGYQAVAGLKSAEEMETFVRRAIESEGLAVTNDHHLQGMVPFYSGQCETQTFDALVKEIHEGQARKNKCKPAWVTQPNISEAQLDFLQTKTKPAPVRPNFFAWLFGYSAATPVGAEAEAEGQAPAQTVDSFSQHAGMFASLDSRGYLAVAASKSKVEMAMFVHRLLKDMKVRVKDEGGLQAILPYYDGECEVQSFGNLQAELERGIARPADCMSGPWLERL